MNYQSFLIANFATGFDREVQPWLLPNDAFTDLLDGFVYRGVLNKRDGYSGFATGTNSTYTESRMVHNTNTGYTVTGDIDGINAIYAIQANPPIVPNSLTITGSNPPQVVTDDGFGGLAGDGVGTVNYATGAIAVTFTAPPAVASTVTIAYGNFSVGDGTATYGPVVLANLPIRRGTVVITAGAQSATDDGVGGFVTVPPGGSGTIDYTTGSVTITFNAVVAVDVPITVTYDSHQGLPVMGIMNFYPTDNVRQLIVADTRYVNKYDPSTDTLVDIPAGTYTGTRTDFWGWVNYASPSFAPRLLFANGVVSATDVIQVYDGTTISNYAPTFASGTTLNARQLFNVRDRLVLVQTIEGGTLFPRRIRISGTGVNSDTFDTTAPGAGFIDVPDDTWLFGAAFNRDDLMFFTESTTWLLKYTGNDVKPFILQKIDGSRGCAAAFSVISYLNRTIAVSPRGLIGSQGYQVDRIDNNIPDYTFDSIDNDQTNFQECFSAFIDEDRDVYLIHPSKGEIVPSSVPDGSSDRILVINFEEDNFAVYRLPLSCMGNFRDSIGILWSDLTAANGYPNWDALSATYDSWAAFPFTKDVPVSIGGGHKGEIWKLNADEGEDNPQKIRAMSVIDEDTVRVTTDWNNYSTGDFIVFEAVGGMTQINDKQAAIKAIVTPYNVFDVNIKTIGFDAYTSGGIASRVVPLEAVGKKLNPWLDQDKKLRCGWMYFYVSVAKTTLTDGFGDPVRAFLHVDVLTNNNEGTNFSNPTFQYDIDCTPINNEEGGKKWVKIWINQVGQFLQFRFTNQQAGAKIQVHATMCGFQPVGRLI